jgi:hypothetical protein
MTKKQTAKNTPTDQPVTLAAKLLMAGFIGFVSIVFIAPVFSAGVFTRSEQAAQSVSEAVNPIPEAQAQTTPTWTGYTFSLHAKDRGCSTDAPIRTVNFGAGQYGYGDDYADGVVGQSFPFTDSDNGEDPDCLAIGLYIYNPISGLYHLGDTPPNQSIVPRDFRIGIRLSEKSCGSGPSGQIQWTPWASQGGGTSLGAFTGGGRDRGDCAWMHYEERDMPAGVKIKDFRTGVSVSNDTMQYTGWARSAPGQVDHTGEGGLPSRWSPYSGNRDRLDPVRIALDVQFVDFYDAEYVSDTVPATMDRSQSGNYGVVMKNKGSVWSTDVFNLDPGSRNCLSEVPTSESDECEETGIAKSNPFKLKRVDSDPSISLTNPTPTSPLFYERAFERTYRVSEWCSSSPGEGSDPPPQEPGDNWPDLPVSAFLWDFLDNFGIKKANAQSSGCTLYYYLDSQTPVVLDVGLDTSVNFPLSISVAPDAAGGLHTLQFQMVQLDGSGNEVPGDAQNPNPFGDVANIDVMVGSGFTLSCGVTQTVPAGTNANYAVSASNFPVGFSSNVDVTMSSNPAGPVLLTSPVVLGPSNSYAATAVVPTVSLAIGTYNLTFSASGGGQTAIPCNAQLVVEPPVEGWVDIDFNGHDGPTTPTPANGSTGTLTWNTNEAVSCTAILAQGPGPARGITPTWGKSQPIANIAEGEQSLVIPWLAQGTTYEFQLDCLTTYGATVTDSVIVNVGVSIIGQSATVDLQCEGPGDTSHKEACAVESGGSALLFWTSSNTSSCDLVPGNLPDDGSSTSSENDWPTGYPTGNLFAETTYVITCPNSDGVSAAATDTLTISLSIPPDPPIFVQGDPSVCGQITLNWQEDSSHDSSIRYTIYRQDDSGWVPQWVQIGTIDNNGTATNYSFTDYSPLPPPALNYYRITARIAPNGPESEAFTELAAESCAPSLKGSFKKFIGTGATAPTGLDRCDLSRNGGAAPLQPGQILESGNLVYFEICVRNSGNQNLTNVQVNEVATESVHKLIEVTYINSEGDCATDLGSGLYRISSLLEDGACSIYVRAKIATPLGAAPSALHYFQNVANVTAVSLPILELRSESIPFIIGADSPTRTETPR